MNKSGIEYFMISPDKNTCNFKLNQVYTWTQRVSLDRQSEAMHLSYTFIFSHDPFFDHVYACT